MMNNYEKTTDEFNYYYKRYKKTMPWKAFKKFGWTKQQVLCEKYNIVITNHKTKKELLFHIIDNSPRYLDIGIKKMDKGFSYFDKAMAEFDRGMQSQTGSKRRKRPSIF